MRTLFLTIILLLFCNLSYAERVTAKGDHRYFGDTSDDDACEHALRRAKLKALEKVLGQTISSEELEKCSTVDGKTNCERNQFFLSSFLKFLAGSHPMVLKFFCLKYFNNVPSFAPISKTTSFLITMAKKI